MCLKEFQFVSGEFLKITWLPPNGEAVYLVQKANQFTVKTHLHFFICKSWEPIDLCKQITKHDFIKA